MNCRYEGNKPVEEGEVKGGTSNRQSHGPSALQNISLLAKWMVDESHFKTFLFCNFGLLTHSPKSHVIFRQISGTCAADLAAYVAL